MAAYEAEAQPRIELLLDALDIKTPEVTVGELEIPPEEEEYQSIQSFTLFPALPKELRDMIWKFALPGPQIIEIEVNHGAGARHINFHFPNNIHWRPLMALHGHFNNAKTDSKLPGLVFASHESRAIGLPAYDRCFTYTPIATSRYEELTDAKVIPLAEIAMPGIVFRPAVDTVYIRDIPNGVADMLEESVSQELSAGNIKSVALDESLFSRNVFWNRCFGFVPEYTGDVLHPTGVSYTAPPWFRDVDEVICVYGRPELNDNAYSPNKMQACKRRIEQQFRNRSTLKKLPAILVLRPTVFENLPRWRK